MKAVSTITKPIFHGTQSFVYNITYRNHKYNFTKILKTLRPLTLRHRRTGTRGLHARRSCLLRWNSQGPLASSTVTPCTPAHDRTTVVSFCLSPLRRTCLNTLHPQVSRLPRLVQTRCRSSAFLLRALQPEHEGNTTLQTVGTFSSYTVQEPTGPSLNTLNLRDINSTFRIVVMFLCVGLRSTCRTDVYVSKQHFVLMCMSPNHGNHISVSNDS